MLLTTLISQADIHLCAYNQLLRHVAGFHTKVYSDPDSRTGLRKVGYSQTSDAEFRLMGI
jgi:hypothetical protein